MIICLAVSIWRISILALTNLERKVISVLAERGPQSGYDFHLAGRRKRGSRKAIMSSGYWLTVKKSLGPEGKKLIHAIIHRGRPPKVNYGVGRRRQPYGLTFYGLLYAIGEGLIQPMKAYSSRVEHQARLPDLSVLDFPKEMIIELKALMVEMEKNFPEYFYHPITFSGVDLTKIKDAPEPISAGLTLLWGWMAFSALQNKEPERVEYLVKGKNLVFSDGTILENYENYTKSTWQLTGPLMASVK